MPRKFALRKRSRKPTSRAEHRFISSSPSVAFSSLPLVNHNTYRNRVATSGRECAVFCLGCGTEIPLRAASCPVCGRVLSASADASEATRNTFSAFPASSGAHLATLASASSLQTGLHSPPPAAPALPRTSATSLLRDTAGRVLLLTVVALAADLLAPWSIVYGQQKTMASSSASTLALLALFALAALPLLRPDYHARPLIAVAPLAVGAFCLGAGIFYWALLNRENALYSAQTQSSQLGWSNNGSAPSEVAITSQSVVVPGFGLYLFLIGGLVLVVIGYRLFLQAALASARATVAVTAPPASHSPSMAPMSPSIPLVTPISSATMAAGPAVASSPLAAMSASEPRSPSAPLPAPIPARRTTAAARDVVLPGSAAWNETPKFPALTHPTRLGGGGRSRQAGIRR